MSVRIGGMLSNSVLSGRRVSITVMNKGGVTTTTNCVIITSRTRSPKPLGGVMESPMKNSITSINTPQNSASATVGVSCRSRTRCRSQSPTSTRSLSRKSTLSLLNCSIAQRTARTQQPTVTTVTGTT